MMPVHQRFNSERVPMYGLNEDFFASAADGDPIHLRELNEVIDSLPGLRAALDRQPIDLAKAAEFNIFGYGSLPTDPHYKAGLKVRDGLLAGWRRDFVCECSRFGTNEKPGLVFGLEKNSHYTQAGGILTYSGLTLQQKAENFREFAKREMMQVKGAPIYRFDIVNVEGEDGRMLPCIACVADTHAPAYAGGKTLHERAAMIATAHNAVYPQTTERKMADMTPVTGSTVKSAEDVRANMHYFVRFALLPCFAAKLEMTSGPQDSNDFARRYRRCVRMESEYFIGLWGLIEDKRKIMDPRRHLFLLEIQQDMIAKYMNPESLKKKAPELLEVLPNYTRHVARKIAEVRQQLGL